MGSLTHNNRNENKIFKICYLSAECFVLISNAIFVYVFKKIDKPPIVVNINELK